MQPIIRVENLSKRYRIGELQKQRASLRETFAASLSAPLKRLRRNGPSDAGTVWALKDVSFEVQPGEVLGIIGRNGAGKSTLLKILSRVTEPTGGLVELYGRIGSMLEVGTGFHPELTGRENVFLNGAILGMKKADIVRRFDEIVAFAEVERFIDTPVKRYSSGMYVRLAFSVAAHFEPEILVIDEVLSVGDMSFQQKCIDKIHSMRDRIKAIILVSHNMISVRAICSRAMLLSAGEIVASGDTGSIVPLYEKLMLEHSRTSNTRDEVEEGMGRIEIEAVKLLDAEDREKVAFETGERLKVMVEYNAAERVTGAVAYAAIRRPDDLICVGTSTKLEGVSLPALEGRGVIEVEIPELVVLPGHYVMDVIFYDQNFEYRKYFLGRKKINFQISSRRPGLDEKYGVFYQKQNWRLVGSRGRTEDEHEKAQA
ncbi:MAG TPA: ABC transporter ATP-binding protein [Pyrinomonadaceae bacterium]|nr:ABC transporter ATP-binding protein [Pyrinomonadaceae bacterium]